MQSLLLPFSTKILQILRKLHLQKIKVFYKFLIQVNSFHLVYYAYFHSCCFSSVRILSRQAPKSPAETRH